MSDRPSAQHVLPKRCEMCGAEISEHATHTGHERWCEICFDKGLCKDMNEHFDNFIRTELWPERSPEGSASQTDNGE